VSPAIYRSDPDSAPGTDFDPDDYRHLIVGKRERCCAIGSARLQ